MAKRRITLGLSDKEKERRENDLWFKELRDRGRRQVEEFKALGVDLERFRGRETSWALLGISPRGHREYLAAKQRLATEYAADDTRRRATELGWKFHRHGVTLEMALSGPITTYASDLVREQLAAGGISQVDFTICTEGGLVEEAVGIVEALRSSGARITTYAQGLCASAGVLLFCCGHVRECHPATSFLIHDCGDLQGNDGSLEDLRVRESVDSQAAEMMAACMHISVDDCRSLMARETRFDSHAALNEGLATAIVDRAAEAAKLRQEFEQSKQREANRLLKRREELARRPVNSFGTLRNVERKYANDWVKMADGRWHFDTDPLAKVRPKEGPEPVRSITPEAATRRYMATLSPADRATFEGHLRDCNAYV